MSFTYSDELISDLHKDARGFRPSLEWMRDWNSYSPIDKQDIWDALVETMEISMAAERRQEAEALARFEQRIQDAVAMGDKMTRKMILHWILKDYDDPDYGLWTMGIGYDDRARLLREADLGPDEQSLWYDTSKELE